jgi:hypothetical protein
MSGPCIGKNLLTSLPKLIFTTTWTRQKSKGCSTVLYQPPSYMIFDYNYFHATLVNNKINFFGLPEIGMKK